MAIVSDVADDDRMRHPHWPPFDVRISTPRLELRPIHGDVIDDVVALADRGIHDPATMPFSVPWTDTALPERHWESVRYYHRVWAEFSPEKWSFPFGGYLDGELIGVQDLLATDFVQLRTVSSGSWIGRDHQGQGYGTEQRVAVLALAFECLDARFAETEAYWDNGPSNAVTQRIGYERNGESVRARRGVADRLLHYRLTREAWDQRRSQLPAVTFDGVEAVLAMLGLA